MVTAREWLLPESDYCQRVVTAREWLLPESGYCQSVVTIGVVVILSEGGFCHSMRDVLVALFGVTVYD